ncbi:hypothetical protein Rsub_09194 [Raphidocelis subcapitata]|uniref:Uncharacterized protein n=1 Tax=Raphidocelis subcapitata TaxID=307507 RepID=A0A2V0PH83_9CHLO|nr:hypothetical protein Rsub_09194 [Raphidocelis subcapitata]|eukprot:GBF96395.1 hypothetical protein Rsub_09194 [Raphidocelis subcapitata]
MEFVPLKRLIEDLLSGDRARQRRAVDEHPPLGPEAAQPPSLQHRNPQITYVDYIRSSDGSTVVLQLDLGIKVPPCYLIRYHFPTLVLLKFKAGPDGAPRLAEQVDHHSMLAVLWLLGWPFTTISEMLIRPLSGFLLSRCGWALDACVDAAAALRAQVATALDALAPWAGPSSKQGRHKAA